jgi:hypothetical protein
MPPKAKATPPPPPPPAPPAAPAVSVLVPWRDSDPMRAAAWDHIRGLWEVEHPDWQLVAGEAPEGPWCKAAAVADALTRAQAPILVVADADVWCDGVGKAVDQVVGGAPWAVPHWRVLRLTANASADVLREGRWPTERTSFTYAERPRPGNPGGGIVVLTRDLYQRAPLDPRFRGWGQEDDAWCLALRALGGREWRGTADLWHLYHPPQSRMSRAAGNAAGMNLYRRYLRVGRNPARVAALLAEIRS